MNKNIKKLILQVRVSGFLNIGKVSIQDVKAMQDSEAKEVLLNIFNLGIIATDEEIENDFNLSENEMSFEDYKLYLSELSTDDIYEKTDLCSIDNVDGFYFEEAYDILEVLKPISKKMADEIDEYTLYEYFEGYKEKTTEIKILTEIRDL